MQDIALWADSIPYIVEVVWIYRTDAHIILSTGKISRLFFDGEAPSSPIFMKREKWGRNRGRDRVGWRQTRGRGPGSGVDARTAYEVVHKDEIIGGAMQYTA